MDKTDKVAVAGSTCRGCKHRPYCEGVAQGNCLAAGRDQYQREPDLAERVATRVVAAMRPVLERLFNEEP